MLRGRPSGGCAILFDLREQVQRALGGAYLIEREITGGGMSRLFLATERSLRRQVVIKLLPRELTSEVSAARFRREIELVARLQHPHILPVYAAGAEDGLLYFVMPYVPGESLRRRLERERQLPVSDALHILHEVSDALAYAHRSGIIHRDVKPENILLEQGHAVLTDFGIARALAQTKTGDRLTRTGMSVGTPGYMAPEQVAGEERIDGRADVYALAVVGYASLTLAQASLQAGRLAPALATQSALDPLASVVLGVLAFHEGLHDTPAELAGALAGLAVMTAGVVVLAAAAEPEPAG